MLVYILIPKPNQWETLSIYICSMFLKGWGISMKFPQIVTTYAIYLLEEIGGALTSYGIPSVNWITL